jgi:acyl dehydratase
MTKRYLEDFAAGQTFGSGRVRVDRERIKTFAAEFDPQPFHLDEEVARDTTFRAPTIPLAGLSSLSTSSLVVNAAVCEPLAANPRAVDELRWPLPGGPETNCASRAKFSR